jgi:hypothetical protein
MERIMPGCCWLVCTGSICVAQVSSHVVRSA